MVDLVFGDKDRVDTVILMGGRAVGVAVSELSVLWSLRKAVLAHLQARWAQSHHVGQDKAQMLLI